MLKFDLFCVNIFCALFLELVKTICIHIVWCKGTNVVNCGKEGTLQVFESIIKTSACVCVCVASRLHIVDGLGAVWDQTIHVLVDSSIYGVLISGRQLQ